MRSPFNPSHQAHRPTIRFCTLCPPRVLSPRPTVHKHPTSSSRGPLKRLQHVEDGNWEDMDAAILGLEREATRLADMKTWTETIQSNSGKILEEVRKMAANLEKQIVVLRESVAALKRSSCRRRVSASPRRAFNQPLTNSLPSPNAPEGYGLEVADGQAAELVWESLIGHDCGELSASVNARLCWTTVGRTDWDSKACRGYRQSPF